MNLLQSLKSASTKATRMPGMTEAASTLLRGKPLTLNSGPVRLYGNDTADLIREGYMGNSDLFSIINYITDKAVQARFYNYEVKDEKAYSDYRQLKGEGATPASLQQASLIKKKALVETHQPDINRLLSNPNPEQDFRSFAQCAIAYKLLSGERFIQKVTGVYDTPRSLYILPPTQITVEGNGQFLGIGRYIYTPTQEELAADTVVFSRTFNPALWGMGDELRGLSPLRVLALDIQRSNEGKLSGVKQYQQSGPPGLLTVTDPDSQLTPEQAQQIEARMMRKGGSGNRGRMHVINYKAEWVATGLSPVDLDLLQSGLFDLRALCRGYKLASIVMGDPTSSTYSNVADARKAALIDAVIPAVQSLQDDLNKAIEEFNVKGKRYFIDADTDHFPELAEDRNTMVDRLMKLPLNPNQVLEAVGYEAVDSPLMNEPWFDNTRTPLSQFSAMGGDGVLNDGTY